MPPGCSSGRWLTGGCSNFNSRIGAFRRANLGGVYDIHTNIMQYPAIMQPTHARAEQVVDGGASAAAAAADADAPGVEASTLFPPVPPKVARNFLVTDITLETPPAGISSASYSRPYGEVPADFMAQFRGLSAVSDDIKDLLPPECRVAFDEALEHETQWHAKWGNEKDKMARREPVVDKGIVPTARKDLEPWR